MTTRPLLIAALGALAAATASPAGAGQRCCCAAPCIAPVAPVTVYQPYEMPRIYVVDRGPVYSGPGIYVDPTVVVSRRMPRYPYVAHDYPAYHGPYYGPALRTRAQHR